MILCVPITWDVVPVLVCPVSSESGGPFIDQVYILQGYAEGWKEGAWEEKIDSRPCIEPPLYSQDKHEYYRYRWEVRGHGPRPGRLLLPHLGTRAVSKYPFPLLMKR